LATAAGVFTNAAFGYLRAYILIAVVAAGGGDVLRGWDGPMFVTFSFVTQGLLPATGVFGEPELAERVRTGDVVVDLYRPVDLQAWWLASWLGRSSFMLLARGIPPILLGSVVFDLTGPGDLGAWAAFLLSVVLATVVGFGLRFIVNLSTFWLLDNRGVDQLVTLVLMFLGGLLVPLVLFPSWLESVARALPFAAMLQLPAEVFVGVHDGASDLVGVLAIQLWWAVALLAAGRLMLGAATRKVELQGG
jgi:ABC-2 type transport system permease protein